MENNNEFNLKLTAILNSVETTLTEKNKRYGNSALDPVNIFSKLSGEEGIKIRLDDKINRIKNSDELRKNDVFDIIGYLILLSVKKGYNFRDLID